MASKKDLEQTREMERRRAAAATEEEEEEEAILLAAVVRDKADLLRESMRRSETVQRRAAAAVASIAGSMAAIDDAVRPAQVPPPPPSFVFIIFLIDITHHLSLAIATNLLFILALGAGEDVRRVQGPRQRPAEPQGSRPHRSTPRPCARGSLSLPFFLRSSSGGGGGVVRVKFRRIAFLRTVSAASDFVESSSHCL
jgi:hypothetical protein